MIEMVQQFNKGAKMMVHSYALMADEMGRLWAANAAATERKQRKKRWIKKGGTLLQAEAEDIIAQKDVVEAGEQETRETRREAGATQWRIYSCKRCGQAGHNRRIFKEMQLNQVINSIYLLLDLAKWLWRYFDLKGG